MLSESPTSLNEDDDVFRNFFNRRYLTLLQLQKDTPGISRETMKWLNDEVFVQLNDEKKTEVDEKQRAFEEDLQQLFLEAKNARLRRDAIARRLIQNTPNHESDEDVDEAEDGEDAEDEDEY